jgi:hypothetical protein
VAEDGASEGAVRNLGLMRGTSGERRWLSLSCQREAPVNAVGEEDVPLLLELCGGVSFLGIDRGAQGKLALFCDCSWLSSGCCGVAGVTSLVSSGDTGDSGKTAIGLGDTVRCLGLWDILGTRPGLFAAAARVCIGTKVSS